MNKLNSTDTFSSINRQANPLWPCPGTSIISGTAEHNFITWLLLKKKALNARTSAPTGTIQFEAMWVPWERAWPWPGWQGPLNHTDCAVMQPESSICHTELHQFPLRMTKRLFWHNWTLNDEGVTNDRHSSEPPEHLTAFGWAYGGCG